MELSPSAKLIIVPIPVRVGATRAPAYLEFHGNHCTLRFYVYTSCKPRVTIRRMERGMAETLMGLQLLPPRRASRVPTTSNGGTSSRNAPRVRGASSSGYRIPFNTRRQEANLLCDRERPSHPRCYTFRAT